MDNIKRVQLIQNYNYKSNMQNFQESQKGFSIQFLTEELICPITQLLMIDPVTIESGHTFEREAIEQWIKKGNKKNPLTGKPIQSKRLTPNLAVKNVISKIPKMQRRIQRDMTKIQKRIQQLQEQWHKNDPEQGAITQTNEQNEIINNLNEKLFQQEQKYRKEEYKINQEKEKLEVQLKSALKQKRKLQEDLSQNLIKNDKERNQLTIEIQKLKKDNSNLTRETKLIRSELVQKNRTIEELKTNKAKLQSQLQVYRRSLKPKTGSSSRQRINSANNANSLQKKQKPAVVFNYQSSKPITKEEVNIVQMQNKFNNQWLRHKLNGQDKVLPPKKEEPIQGVNTIKKVEDFKKYSIEKKFGNLAQQSPKNLRPNITIDVAGDKGMNLMENKQYTPSKWSTPTNNKSSQKLKLSTQLQPPTKYFGSKNPDQ